MNAICPNCEAEVAAAAPSCPTCKAQFGAGGWTPFTTEENAGGAGPGICAGLSAAAGLFAWIVAIGPAVSRSLEDSGSISGISWFIARELHRGVLAPGLAGVAIQMAAATLIASRGKVIPWTGLIGGGVFLAIRYF